MEKSSILDLPFETLLTRMLELGEPRFRVEQLWQGIYKQLWLGFEEFTNLPKPLREKMSDVFNYHSLSLEQSIYSRDQLTQKVLFRTHDGEPVEAALMRYERRQSICISSQAGCPMGCVFCATGQMGIRRSLMIGEIIEQVLYFARLLKNEGVQITNIVIMGMGEPMLNYDAVLGAIDLLNDPRSLNLGARRFTISTVGILPGIKRFTSEDRQINLAVSLHAANDELRSKLIPANRKYPLSSLIQTCREYTAITNRRLSFEWALIQGVNDSREDARQLAGLIKGMLCHVNIIPLNPTLKYPGMPTTRQKAEEFKEELESHGIPCTIRLRRGVEIHAGCGQLASMETTGQLPK